MLSHMAYDLGIKTNDMRRNHAQFHESTKERSTSSVPRSEFTCARRLPSRDSNDLAGWSQPCTGSAAATQLRALLTRVVGSLLRIEPCMPLRRSHSFTYNSGRAITSGQAAWGRAAPRYW